MILPLLLLLLLGVIEVGRLMAIFSSVSSAARQAARYGSVGGDSGNGMPYYLDCAGMRGSAKNTSLLQPLNDSDISIRYDRGSLTDTIGLCQTGSLTPTLSADVQDGDRVVISITTTYRPLVPIVPLSAIPMSFVAAHTIFTTIIGPTPTPLPNPDLVISKVGNPAFILPTGSTDLTYTLQVTNTGPVEANGLIVTDTLPASINPNSVSILLPPPAANGIGWTCSPAHSLLITCRLPFLGLNVASSPITLTVSAPITPGLITNVANVTYAQADPNPANNTASATTFIATWVDLVLQNLNVANPVAAGGPVTYALTVKNNNWIDDPGPQVVTDTLPPSASFVSAGGPEWACNAPVGGVLSCTRNLPLSVGSTAPTITVLLTAPLPGAIPPGGFITNRASAGGTLGDPFPLNNTNIVVTTSVTTEADLAMFKSGPALTDSGTTFFYTMHVTNNGPSVATNVRVVDTPPAPIAGFPPGGSGWTCTTNGNQVSCVWPFLAAGATTNDITLTVMPPDSNVALVNTASVSSDEPDHTPANNTASVTTNISTCHASQVDPSRSTVTASPTSVGADSTSKARVLVTLRDACGNVLTAPPYATQQVTLTSSRGGQDTVTLASGYNNPTSNGQVAFDVNSRNEGTSTYSAVARDTVSNASVNVAQTAQVTFFYDCVTLSVRPPGASQSFLQYQVDNTSGFKRHLTNLSMSWTQNGLHVNSVQVGATVVGGGNNNNPFVIPSGGLNWNAGTDAARTLNSGTTNQTLQLNFNKTVDLTQSFTLQTTWDDGSGGHICTAP